MKALIEHEYKESMILKNNKEDLQKYFENGDLETHLKKFLKGLKADSRGEFSEERINMMMKNSPKPITPYYYAHIKAHYTDAPNPPPFE
ncbi:hypothetical protein MHK_006542 [Candidatus Magnetomorum sp. HK-1]|nr:hypothetical protein MHK_006542 [Candidatus Magnetomorum sp. HK-1]